MVMRNGLAYIDPLYKKLIVLKMRPELMKIEIINQHKYFWNLINKEMSSLILTKIAFLVLNQTEPHYIVHKIISSIG
jgi:hypothetical protein